jgi:SAM-dependent methyltransferase
VRGGRSSILAPLVGLASVRWHPRWVIEQARRRVRQIVFARRIVMAARILRTRARLAIGVRPLSAVWGFDRGIPIARHYVAQFLTEFADDIRGHCLEFQGDSYLRAFGRERVTCRDILHKTADNPRATLVADLTRPNALPSDTFDCIVCTYVLHVIYESDRAVAELHRMLKPGGVLLLAVPMISMDGPGHGELWRFTPGGLQAMLARAFGADHVVVRPYGNSLIAAGQIRGMVTHEFTRREREAHDPRFAIVVCARAVKGSGG